MAEAQGKAPGEYHAAAHRSDRGSPRCCSPLADLKAVANFLRNKSGIKLRVGVLNGKRVDYFKGVCSLVASSSNDGADDGILHVGRAAVKAILSPAYAKLSGVPKITSEGEANLLLHSLIPHTFYLRVTRGQASGPGGPKVVQVNPQQLFAPDEYYAWFMDANPIKLLLGAIGMVAVVLAAVMFPLWPASLRVGVWYLSIGVLGLVGLFFVIAIVRLIFWLITIVVAKPGIWIFPNLFADVGFVRTLLASPRVLTDDENAGGLVHPILGLGRTGEEVGQEREGEEGEEGQAGQDERHTRGEPEDRRAGRGGGLGGRL
jgi:protein translocation Sec62 family protein